MEMEQKRRCSGRGDSMSKDTEAKNTLCLGPRDGRAGVREGRLGGALKILECQAWLLSWRQWGVMEGCEQRRSWGEVLSLSGGQIEGQ